MTEAKMAQAVGVVVSHTHWDREWYLPFQRFRIKLVDLVDTLLDILDQDFEYRHFMLDGQTVVLEDYLEIRPENRERLAKYIREGRILIGPWYVLPDEFLPSGESLVRNLLLGQLMSEPLGGVMPVGYLPDTFGHPAQMPQLLRGFGLDNAVIYRGVQTDRSEFMWEAPDGSSVLTIYLPDGYWNAVQVGIAPQRFLDQAPRIVAELAKRSTTGNLLLMNGIDHLTPCGGIEETIAAANQRLDNGVKLCQGTLPQYVKRVKAANPTLQTRRGEFRNGRPARVTPGVISSRMNLKQENFRAEVALEKYAEPVWALAWLMGATYPRALLWSAWRYLLQNQPHDSICGCSVDEVPQDMLVRYRWSREIAEDLTTRGLESLARRVAATDSGDEATFMAFNGLGQSRRDYGEHYVHFLEANRQFHVRDSRGAVVPHQVLGRQPAVLTYEHWTGRVELDGKQKPTMVAIPRSELAAIRATGLWQKWEGEDVALLVLPGEVPASGYTTYRIGLGEVAAPQTDLAVGPDWLENDRVKVVVNGDGTLDLEDKWTGLTSHGLNTFESRGECGDEYTACPTKVGGAFTRCEFAPTVRLVESGPVRATFEIEATLRLPRGLTENRMARSDELVECPLVMRVSLSAGSPRVEVRVELTNRAEDHVFRVLFPTPIQTEWSDALGQFEVVRRPVSLPAEELAHVPGPGEEAAVNTYPHHQFVDVNDGRCGLAVLSRGLTEYEVLPGAEGVTVALTLLRCVGWLSRGDLPTRHDHAGPGLPTPEAQCPGRYVFEWAIVPHAGDWCRGGIPSEAERYAAPVRSVLVDAGLPVGPRRDVSMEVGRGEASLPAALSFVAVEPPAVVVSALKKAERDEAIILRFYNTSGEPVCARVHLSEHFRAVRLVDLAEREVAAAPLIIDADNTVNIEMRGSQICSLQLQK